MPLNPNIILQGKAPEFESPVNALTQMVQLEGAQSRNKLADIMLNQHQRELDDDKNARQAYIDNPDPKDRLTALAKVSPKLYQAEAKFQDDRQKEKLSIDKDTFDLVTKRINWTKQNLAEMIPDPNINYQTIVGRLTDGLQAGVLDDKSVHHMLQGIPQTNDPKSLRDYLTRSLAGTMSSEQQFLAYQPKTEFKDTGGQILGIQNNPNLPGYLQPVTALKKTMTPGEIATDARGKEANRLKAQENSIIGGKTAFEAEGKMADDHKAQSKNFIDVRDAYTRLNSSLKSATNSPAATLAGATVFMKLLDPGSVVRESELGMALQATGALDRATNYFNVLKNGKVLTPSQVADFQAIGAQLYKAAEQSQGQLDATYKKRAQGYGLSADNIVTDYRAPTNSNAPAVGASSRPALDTFFKR